VLTVAAHRRGNKTRLPAFRVVEGEDQLTHPGPPPPGQEGAISSARNRAAFNWYILRSLGEKLHEVFEADMSKPLPSEIANLLDRFEDAQRQSASRPRELHRDTAVVPSPSPPT
jgi:hypothetical protein